LGPSGYSRSGGRRVANADSDSYSNCATKSDTYTEFSGFSDAQSDSDSYSDGDAKGGAKTSAHTASAAVSGCPYYFE
jgi:hypothetical protein